MTTRVSVAAFFVACSLTGSLTYGQTNPRAIADNTVERPFPSDARVAYVDVDRLASLTLEGRAAIARLDDLRAKKSAELAAMSKALDDLQARLNATANIIADAARTRLQWQFQRAQVDLRRASEDAQSDLEQARQEATQAFSARVFPVVGEVAKEKRIWAVFRSDSGLIWHDPDTDLTQEVAARLDAAAKQ